MTFTSKKTLWIKVVLMMVLALVLGSSGVSYGEEEEDTPAVREAKELYNLANDSYAQGDYEAALTQFWAAYKRVDRSTKYIDFLYNIARCEIKLGRNRDAADHLQEYLKVVPDDGTAKAELERIEELLKPKATPAAPTASGDSAPAPTPAKPTTRPRILTGLLLTLGGVGLVGGGISLAVANSRYDDLLKGCMQRCDPSVMETVTQPRNIGIGMMVGGGLSLVLAIVSGVKGY